MKKKNLKNLSLNKKSVSNLNEDLITGGDVSIGKFTLGCTDGCTPFQTAWNCSRGNCTGDCDGGASYICSDVCSRVC